MSEQESNESIKTIDPDAGTGAVERGLALVNQADAAFKPLYVDMPAKDYTNSFKVAKGRIPYLEEGMQRINEHPEYLSGKLNQASVQAQFRLWKSLQNAANRLEAVWLEMRKAQYTLGTRLYTLMSGYERRADHNGRHGDVTGATIASQMKAKR
jgi:hypothetical protein